jgi:Glycosyltransferase family 87
MKTINLFRATFAAGLASLVIIYTILWLQMISSPAERTGSDFISAYTGGRVATRWGAENAYNLEYQKIVQTEVVGFALAPGQVLMFNHPPYLLPLLSLLMDGNYINSLVRYAVLMAALYTAALVAAWRLLRLNGWERSPAALAVAGLATFYPVFVSLVNTQDTALMVLGGVLVLFGVMTGHDWLAGLGLALTTVRPHITVLLTVPFIFRRQKVFLWFCVASAVLGLVSLLVAGTGGLQAYLKLLLTAAGGQFYGMQERAMVNLIGLLTRLTPGLGTQAIHWIGWIVYGLTLIGLCALWARSRKIGEKQIGVAAAMAVLGAPHLHYHDLALLSVAFLGLLLMLARDGFVGGQKAALIPLVISLVLIVGFSVGILKYNLPILVIILLVIALVVPGAIFRGREIPEQASR